VTADRRLPHVLDLARDLARAAFALLHQRLDGGNEHVRVDVNGGLPRHGRNTFHSRAGRGKPACASGHSPRHGDCTWIAAAALRGSEAVVDYRIWSPPL